MEKTARFSVWGTQRDADSFGPDHVTWHGALQEWRARNGIGGPWYIWDHSAYPTKNVTDKDPSLPEAPEDPFLRGAPGDPFPWWVCRYSHDEYTASGPYKPMIGEEVSAFSKNNDGLSVSAIFQCQEEPSYEIFALIVASRLGIILPELKEEQWCWTTEGGWKLMNGNMVTKYSSPEYKRFSDHKELVRVYGTIANRDERKDAILKVMREVGPKEWD